MGAVGKKASRGGKGKGEGGEPSNTQRSGGRGVNMCSLQIHNGDLTSLSMLPIDWGVNVRMKLYESILNKS